MSVWARAGMLALPLVLGGVGSAQIPAPPVVEPVALTHRTLTGATLQLPPLSGQSCADLRWLMRRIDRSNYRGRGLLAPDHPDYPVFLYEDALAAAVYVDCTLRESRRLDPQAVFSRGFGAD